jgi:hypothetical protein
MVQGWHDISTKHTSSHLARYEIILKMPQRLAHVGRIKHYNTVKVVWLWFGANKTPCDVYSLHNPGPCRLVEQFSKLYKKA